MNNPETKKRWLVKSHPKRENEEESCYRTLPLKSKFASEKTTQVFKGLTRRSIFQKHPFLAFHQNSKLRTLENLCGHCRHQPNIREKPPSNSTPLLVHLPFTFSKFCMSAVRKNQRETDRLLTRRRLVVYVLITFVYFFLLLLTN